MADLSHSREIETGAGQVLDDLLVEVSEKLHAGEPVDLEDYARRYPELSAQLRHMLPAMRALADLGLSSVRETSGTPRPNRSDAVSGVLGDFRILREIGRGGMGVVYEAEQISLGRRMALKVLPFAGVLDERQLTRFRNEARAAASLNHPNVVGVHSVGTERGVHYYAMEFIEGQTLAQVIAERRPSSLVIEQRRPSSPLPQAGEGPGVRAAARGTDPTVSLADSPPLPLFPPSPTQIDTLRLRFPPRKHLARQSSSAA
jgi:serine/threonine-protein kinase